MSSATAALIDGMTIELQPHPAHKLVHGIKVPIILDQQQIMVGGVRVGYCGVGPGKPINFIRRYPEGFKDAVAAHVQQCEGGISSLHEPPPVPERHPEHDDDSDDETTEDEE